MKMSELTLRRLHRLLFANSRSSDRETAVGGSPPGHHRGVAESLNDSPAPSPWDQLLSSLQSVPCNLCDVDDASILVRESPAPLVRCNRCGLAYFNPQPTARALRDYYSSELAGTYTPQLREWYGELTPERVRDRTAELRSCEAWLMRSTDDGPIRFLEVGCAFGHQLHCAKQLGWEPVGIEISGPAAEWVRSELGLNVLHGTVDEVAGRLPEASFDLILMSHVLEHVPSPAQTVRGLVRLLKPNGVLVIYVPNGQGLQARHAMADWEWKCFPDHLYYFGPHSLSRMLASCGLKVARMWTCLGHSNREQIFGLIRDRLCLDSIEPAEAAAEALGQVHLLSDLRVVARKL